MKAVLILLAIIALAKATELSFSSIPVGATGILSVAHGRKFAFATKVTAQTNFQPTRMVTRTNVAAGLIPLNMHIEVAIYRASNGARLCAKTNTAILTTAGSQDYAVDVSTCSLIGAGDYNIAWMLNGPATNLQMFVNNFDNTGSQYYYIGGSGADPIPNNFSPFTNTLVNVASESWIEGTYIANACLAFPCAIGVPGESCADVVDSTNSTAGRTCTTCSAGLESTDGRTCTEFDACAAFPCVGCTDIPAPTGDYTAAGGRTCPFGAPDQTTISGTHDGRDLTITWPLPNNNGLPLTSCQLEMHRVGKGKTQTFNLGPSTTSKFFPNAKKAAYSFRVRCQNSEGWAPWSAPGSDTIRLLVPDRVTTNPGITTGVTTADITFVAPNDHGSAITQYQILVKSLKTVPTKNFQFSVGTGTSFTITGLQSGTRYNVRVKAANRFGFGRYGNHVLFVTK